MDAFYQVAIWESAEKTLFSLKEIKQALEYPKFPLYLGRKSCPLSLPLYPVIFSNVNLKQAFDEYPLNIPVLFENSGSYRGEKTAKLKQDQYKAREWWTDKLGASHLVSYFWEKDHLQKKDSGMSPTMIYPRCDQVISRKRWQFSNREECYYAENPSESKG